MIEPSPNSSECYQVPPSRGQGGTGRIIIAGGGTGGHIFPAIAIANAIKQTGTRN